MKLPWRRARYALNKMPNPLASPPDLSRWGMTTHYVAEYETTHYQYRQWVIRDSRGKLVIRGVEVNQVE